MGYNFSKQQVSFTFNYVRPGIGDKTNISSGLEKVKPFFKRVITI